MQETLIDRLRIRASIRRTAVGRKSVEEGKPDRLADLLDEAALALEDKALDTVMLRLKIRELEDALKQKRFIHG